jgi:hypothetical protein
MQKLIGLCNVLLISNEGSNYERIERIKSTSLKSERDYVVVLKMMWEGTIIEYLRSIGMPMKLARQDPRTVALKHWRSRRAEKKNPFDRLYVPRTLKVRSKERSTDPAILNFLRDIKDRDEDLKECERYVRTEKDFRAVIGFFNALSHLREVEKEGRNYLIDELETARARFNHMQSTLNTAEEQMLDLEERYLQFTQKQVTSNAVNETMVEFYFSLSATSCNERYQLERDYLDERVTNVGTQMYLRDDLCETKRALTRTQDELARTKEKLHATTKLKEEEERKNAQLRTQMTDLANCKMNDDARNESIIDMLESAVANEAFERRSLENNINNVAHKLLGYLVPATKDKEKPKEKKDGKKSPTKGKKTDQRKKPFSIERLACEYLLDLGIFDQAQLESKLLMNNMQLEEEAVREKQAQKDFAAVKNKKPTPKYLPGTTVDAKYRKTQNIYRATIVKASKAAPKNEVYHIVFEDGHSEVRYSSGRPTYTVRYEDGEEENGVLEAHLKFVAAPPELPESPKKKGKGGKDSPAKVTKGVKSKNSGVKSSPAKGGLMGKLKAVVGTTKAKAKLLNVKNKIAPKKEGKKK